MNDENKKFRAAVEKAYAKVWGKRCVPTDLEEFPELKADDPTNRCACCYAYELLDKHLDNLDIEIQKWFNKER